MAEKVIFNPSSTVVKKVTQLPELSIGEIKALWQELFNDKAPTRVRPFLERRLAYKLQETEFSKKHWPVIEENERRIKAAMEADASSDLPVYPQIIPGAVLTRIYQEREYRVTITHERQFEFEGRLFNSLSVIAREITGSHLSGPRFFGLKRSTAKKKRTGKARK